MPARVARMAGGGGDTCGAPKQSREEERILHADRISLRPWDGFGRKDLGFRAKGKERAREGERK